MTERRPPEPDRRTDDLGALDAIERAELRQMCKAYEGAVARQSLWQLANSFLPFFAICGLMYWSLGVSFLLTAALAVVAAGLVVRIFVIQHDCGHGAFFRARWANELVGMLCSLVTLTPYLLWRRQHAGHHSHWNNLDQRLAGIDIYSGCLTVAEYEALSPLRRRWLRVLQHPVTAWLVLPPAVFLLLYRTPFDAPRAWRRERRGVYLTNLGLVGLVLGLGFSLGFRSVALVQLPVIAIAATIGVGLFSVQHRFERSLWARAGVWNNVSASLEGSSYLQLPRVLQWFTGNIGFHHVHHLNPRIPNYRLQACHAAIPALHSVHVLTPWQALRAWRAALWDEGNARMVPFAKAFAARQK